MSLSFLIFHCGVIFHLLSGCSKESKACLDFALMMADYCLMQQIKTFGEALMSQYVVASDDCQRYGENKSIFDQLPPAFSLEDLAAMKRDNTPRNSLIKIISRWKRDGWIGKTGHNRWNKVAQASATKMTMTK